MALNRRDFLRNVSCHAAASVALGSTLASRPVWAAQPPKPLELTPGPQLFLDDYLIDRMEGLARRVEQPQRQLNPVLDSATFGTTQPYLTALYDHDQARFRMWYNRGPAIWHAQSADGIVWTDPRVAWDLPRGYGCSLVDDGPAADPPGRRFKLANWQATREREDKPGDDAGMWVGFSPDGLEWTAWPEKPVLATWPEGYGRMTRHGVGDTVDVYYDAPARCYRAAVKVHALAEDGYAPGPKAGGAIRRLVGIASSDDFIHWNQPRRILAPDDKDEGLLEFYGMGGMHLRGGLRIGLARVLRDDLPCDPGGPRDGIGYTVLVTSRDGVHWNRYREPFFDRNHEPGSWDHAMAWMSAVVLRADELYFYYGGYARGHKIEAHKERQIGMARLKKDRYVALVPNGDAGWLRTPPFVMSAQRLSINARCADGRIAVRLLDAECRPLDDLGQSEAEPIQGDQLAAEVRWPKPLTVVSGKACRLEIRLERAALFAVELHGPGRSVA